MSSVLLLFVHGHQPRLCHERADITTTAVADVTESEPLIRASATGTLNKASLHSNTVRECTADREMLRLLGNAWDISVSSTRQSAVACPAFPGSSVPVTSMLYACFIMLLCITAVAATGYHVPLGACCAPRSFWCRPSQGRYILETSLPVPVGVVLCVLVSM